MFINRLNDSDEPNISERSGEKEEESSENEQRTDGPWLGTNKLREEKQNRSRNGKYYIDTELNRVRCVR